MISIHALREEGDLYPVEGDGLVGISIHALREEGDRHPRCRSLLPMRFLSTPSARRATLHVSVHLLRRLDFYPRPPRGGRPPRGCPTAGGDLFLSTPSARRATRLICGLNETITHFYPRPPRGGRRYQLRYIYFIDPISIHALREEGDRATQQHCLSPRYFYPRPPRGGRHTDASMVFDADVISIHALREEGDGALSTGTKILGDFYPRPPRGGRRKAYEPDRQRPYFYPRPPRGGRPHASRLCCALLRFLSTPSARRATKLMEELTRTYKISIHALREEGDRP